MGGNSYKSGKQLLAENQELAKAENGFYVTVPIDYQDHLKGTTDLYAYFRKTYDPKLPTYFLFTGGPGQSSHFPVGKADMYADVGYNFLLFDQRGIAFSRPSTEEMFKSPAFYASEKTARDAEEIRKHLKLDKISIYGVSYGTVPATIYASLFPSTARSVILEGVVYDGFDMTPQLDNFLINVVQKYFNSLTSGIKDKISRLANSEQSASFMFPSIVKAYLQMGGDQFLENLTKLLIEASKEDDSKFWSRYSELVAEANRNAVKYVNLDEDTVNFMLMGKEFGFSRSDISDGLILKNGRIVRSQTNSYIYSSRELGLPMEQKSTYLAKNYPIRVPVYYINGSRDGATIPPWVIKHYKNIPQGPAYLMILKHGGHMPGGQVLMVDRDQLGVPQKQATYFFKTVFNRMLTGELVDKRLVDEFNGLGMSKFAFTSKSNLQRQCKSIISK
jgi:proline iminopeptidase